MPLQICYLLIILSLLPFCYSQIYSTLYYSDMTYDTTNVAKYASTFEECSNMCCDSTSYPFCSGWVWVPDDGPTCYLRDVVGLPAEGTIKIRYSGYRDTTNCTTHVSMWVIQDTGSLAVPDKTFTHYNTSRQCIDYCSNDTKCYSIRWKLNESLCDVYKRPLNYLNRSEIHLEWNQIIAVKNAPYKPSSNSVAGLIILATILPASAGALLLGVLLLIFIKSRLKKRQKKHMVETELEKRWEINFNDIKIVSEIGQGGFGVVYKGLWRNSNCAVKQLSINSQDISAVKEFLKEADIVRNLRPHKNVCTVFGICSKPENPICIVMEYVDGGSLETHIMKNKINLTPLVIVRLAKDIASGMSHIHAENILHCDLVVKEEEEDKYIVKVTDFGLARNSKTDVYQASQNAKFPIRWSAPEVLSGRKLSRGADVWSFGVVLWEILEAKVPFFEFENKQVVFLVCEKGARLPKPTRVEYPSEIWKMIQECWNEDPTQRPSFDSLFTQLQSLESELCNGTVTGRTNITSSSLTAQTTYQSIKDSILAEDSKSRYEFLGSADNQTNYGVTRESLFMDSGKPPTPPLEGLIQQATLYGTVRESLLVEPAKPPTEDV